MGTIEALSLAMGTAWTSGINLYATVAALGIANRMEMIHLPQNLEVLSHPGVIAIACVMYLIEFFADKVPYVDSGWDALHTFIRVPAGAILAAQCAGRSESGIGIDGAARRRFDFAGRPRHQSDRAPGDQREPRAV